MAARGPGSGSGSGSARPRRPGPRSGQQAPLASLSLASRPPLEEDREEAMRKAMQAAEKETAVAKEKQALEGDMLSEVMSDLASHLTAVESNDWQFQWVAEVPGQHF